MNVGDLGDSSWMGVTMDKFKSEEMVKISEKSERPYYRGLRVTLDEGRVAWHCCLAEGYNER